MVSGMCLLQQRKSKCKRGRKTLMKRLIGCPAGEWAKKLYTLDRFEKLQYFLDEKEGEYGYDCYGGRGRELKKQVYAWSHLENENIDELVVIINDTRNYDRIKIQLERYGLKENKHFFNGWKLDSNFYHEVYEDKNWIDFEKEDSMALIRQQAGWRKRAEMLACLIPSDVRSVMDIGCGECLLKEFLPQNVRYYGLDYKQRYKDTIVCDINKDNLPKLDVDLYYLAGVIDYIHNIPQFIKQFKNAKYVIMSKARNERFIRLDDKIMDKGYMNFGISAYYISDLLTDMSQNGFFCKKMEWNYKERDEYYFWFINKDMM